MKRREVLSAILGACAAGLPRAGWSADAAEPGLQLGPPAPFSPSDLRARVAAMAASPYAPRAEVPQPWLDLSYDQYRSIWFDVRNALWQGTERPLRLDVFHPGLYFPRSVAIHAVEGGVARPVLFDLAVFDQTDKVPPLPNDPALGFSGFRLRAEIEAPTVFQEFFVMQGASYFRGIGTGQIYGLSARGLAIDTAEPSGEEFPDFTEFYIDAPAPGASRYTVHAVMDSPRATGLYRFVIAPGLPLQMDVSAEIFARERLRHVGLGPLTSMFLFDQTNRDRFSDFRPAVHDSDGLLIHNGAGEMLWRPLANPRRLQVSGFLDDSPKGFGLMQRARRFGDFADLEALYHRRPGLWVAPGEDWGRGSVTLVEIPTDKEIYDNIVAYWRPSAPLEADESRQFTYRLSWGIEPPGAPRLARVLNTAMGARFGGGGLTVVIDFEATADIPDDLSVVTKLIRGSEVETTPGVLQRNPETGGPRLAFSFDPGTLPLVEFRAQLRAADGAPLTEVWLYRWTA